MQPRPARVRALGPHPGHGRPELELHSVMHYNHRTVGPVDVLAYERIRRGQRLSTGVGFLGMPQSPAKAIHCWCAQRCTTKRSAIDRDRRDGAGGFGGTGYGLRVIYDRVARRLMGSRDRLLNAFWRSPNRRKGRAHAMPIAATASGLTEGLGMATRLQWNDAPRLVGGEAVSPSPAPRPAVANAGGQESLH